MTDLFTAIRTPPQRKVGHANGEFLGRLASLTPHQRAQIKPADYPEADPTFVLANVQFHGGNHA